MQLNNHFCDFFINFSDIMYEKSLSDCSISISDCSIGEFPSIIYITMLHWYKLTYIITVGILHATVYSKIIVPFSEKYLPHAQQG